MSRRPSSALPAGTNDFYASLVDRCVEGVVEALGTTDLGALLLIGAPARGEPTVVETENGPYSLSDIDLACLCRAGPRVPELRARLARWVTGANAELSDRCAGVDASLRVVPPPSRVPPRIATYEMLRSPAVLWGDESLLAEFPVIDAEDVPAWDGLVLFHNRTVEQIVMLPSLLHGAAVPGGGAAPGGERRQAAEARQRSSGGARQGQMPGHAAEGGGPYSSAYDNREALHALYTSGKYLLDGVTALLFQSGNVPETYEGRARAFTEDLLRRAGRERLMDSLREFLPDIEAWARFKSSGRLGSLAKALGGAADDVPGLARRCFLRYARCSGTLWRAVLGPAVGAQADDMSAADAVALYSRLESPPRKAVRALKLLRSPSGRAGLFSAYRVLRLSTFASPRELAYLTAVLSYGTLADEASVGELGRLLDRLCPFSVPRSFADMDVAEKRRTLAQRLTVFHRSVLKGREIAEGP